MIHRRASDGGLLGAKKGADAAPESSEETVETITSRTSYQPPITLLSHLVTGHPKNALDYSISAVESESDKVLIYMEVMVAGGGLEPPTPGL